MLELLIGTFVTFFVVVDPLGITPIFAALTATDTSAQRRRNARHGVMIAGVVLLAFAFGGKALLAALGIGLPAFRIAGGILLLLLSIDMVMARSSGLRATTAGEEEEGVKRADISVFPLAVPLIAGPGTLTSVILLMGRAEGDAVAQAVVVAVLLAVLALTLLCLLGAGQLMRLLGVTGVNVITRVFGVVVAALAVQYVIDGALAVWPGA